MLKKLWGSLLALIPVAIGGAILLGKLTADTLDTESGRSKTRFLKSVLSWLLDNLGATATGGILIAIGVIALVMIWKPSKDTPESSTPA
jgi:branched-subunit amino acid transport protein